MARGKALQARRFFRLAMKWQIACAILLIALSTEHPYAQSTVVGVGRIEGIVVDGTNRPLLGVEVTLRGTDRRVTTDRSGRFIFERVPAGTWTLLTGKPGYMPARLQGVELPGNSGIPVQVSAGANVEERLRVYPAAIVSGRVVDPQGRPLQGILVAPFRYVYGQDGQPVVRSFPGVRTNDLGDFRIANLESGRYHIRAMLEGWRINIEGQRYTAVTYYPGTTDPRLSEDVLAPGGTETSLGQIVMRFVPGGRLHVRVSEALPAEANPQVVLDIRPRHLPLLRTRVEGRIGEPLESGPLVLGTYDVEVATLSGRRAGAVVEIGLGDVYLDLTVPSDGSVIGRVLASREDAFQPVPGLAIGISSTVPWQRSPVSLSAATNESGVFQFSPVRGGVYHMSVEVPPGWYLTAITDGARSLVGEEFAVDGDHIKLTLGIAQGAASVAGLVRDGGGRPVRDAIVVIVPATGDSKYLRQATRTDRSGLFLFEGLAPGRYRLYSWRELDGPAYRSGEFMRDYSGQGVDVDVDAGGQASVGLTLLSR